MNCMICANGLKASPDALVLCEYKEGMVHRGCCTAKCSWDGTPCVHGVAFYEKK